MECAKMVNNKPDFGGMEAAVHRLYAEGQLDELEAQWCLHEINLVKDEWWAGDTCPDFEGDDER